MVTAFLFTHIPNFNSLSLSPDFGLWWGLEVPDWGFTSWSWFEYGYWSLTYLYSKFWLSILMLKVQRTSMSFKSWFGVLIGDGGFWLGFGILILIWIWSLFFGTPIIWILALYLDFESAKYIHVFKSSFWDWEDIGCSGLGFGILILIWIRSLAFDTPIFQILDLYLGW